MIEIPGKYNEYRWIANIFSRIKGVKDIKLDFTEDGMNLLMTNGKEGAFRKTYEFPLRRLFYADYDHKKDVKNEYDVLLLDDPNAMVEIGRAKAYVHFNDIVIN